jgi:hypothetical protein
MLCQEKPWAEIFFRLSSSFYWTPDRSSRGGIRVATGQQHLQLVRFEPTAGTVAGWPVLETPLRKPFLTEPVTLTIVKKDLDRGTSAIAKDKRAATHRILLQMLTAKGGQTIDTSTKVDRFGRHQDSHRGTGGNHDGTLHKLWATSMT